MEVLAARAELVTLAELAELEGLAARAEPEVPALQP
jgi:hypothetical protein